MMTLVASDVNVSVSASVDPKPDSPTHPGNRTVLCPLDLDFGDRPPDLSLSASITVRFRCDGDVRFLISIFRLQRQVTDHCAIDLDQRAIEVQLAVGTDESFSVARKIYEEGGHSKSYAQISLTTPLTADLKEGVVIYGKNADDNEVAGKAYKDYDSGSDVIRVQYSTTDLQESYVGCQVGGLLSDDHNLKGCFKGEGVVKIGDTEYAYQYDPATENNNARTIAGFSTGARGKMLDGCKGCPYDDFQAFYDYYGKDNYADEWVQAAFDGTSTDFRNGNADFSRYTKVGREQIIKKGTAYLHIFMYVIREFEDALDDCEKNCINCNDGSVHAWDEGVCFYTGSIEGQDGLTDDGKLLHQLADKRCADYMTCGPSGTDSAGMSKLNYDLLDLFAKGKIELQSGNCPAAEQTAKAILAKMYIPMIQGTMRYAYKVDELSGGEKEKAEGAAFAAAVLPQVHAANPNAARIVYENMKVGASDTNFKEVKAAFESAYPQMKISCADVGGLYNEATKSYYPGMEPCSGGYGVAAASPASARDVGSSIAAAGIVVGALFAMIA
ncbi:hypothetical protein ACHAWF_008593 [Thalassiosira exigua]